MNYGKGWVDVFEYYPGTSLLHRLDIRVKMTLLLSFVTAVLLFNHPAFLVFFAVLASIFYAICRVPFSYLWKMITPMVPLLIFILLFSGFTYTPGEFHSDGSKQVLFYVGFGNQVPFIVGGFYFGISLILRIYTMIVLSSIVILTTPVEDFLLLMRKLRFPSSLTFMVVTGIRFVPTMQKKADQVLAAQKARGASLQTKGVFAPILAYIPVMVPLIVESLRMSDQLAVSMLNRGYGASPKWTALKELHITMIDFVTLCLGILFFLFIVYLRWMGYGNI